MALLMICSEHCVYVDLGEHKQLEKIFPLDFNRIFSFFSLSLPEMYSVRMQALRKVSRNRNASTGWWLYLGWGKAFFFQVEYVTDMVIKMGSNRNENEGENIWSFKRHRAHIQQERRASKSCKFFWLRRIWTQMPLKGKELIVPNLELVWNFKNSGGFFKLVTTMILSKMVFLVWLVFFWTACTVGFTFVYADNLTVLI